MNLRTEWQDQRTYTTDIKSLTKDFKHMNQIERNRLGKRKLPCSG
jgi:hypothetical protein